MNKKIIKVLILIFIFSLTFVNDVNADGLSERLKGKILLQVELNGEAWYVNPDNLSRYYLGRPADAFNVMRELGLGISNKDFDSFNNIAPKRLSGKILIKVEDNGEAYYVNPSDLRMHYLNRPADAFQIMRELGLGITNDNLEKIKIAEDINADINYWYAVKLVNNEIYYGQIGDTKADPVTVKNVYYNYNQAIGDNAENDSAPDESGNLRLVKRGEEIHGPTGEMSIVRSQILFIEQMKEDSNVLNAILNYERVVATP